MQSASRTRHVLASALLVLVTLAPAPAQAVDRDALEAAIVYNLLLFIEWPAENAWESRTLTLCLDAASPLLPATRALDGRQVRGLRLAVQPLDAQPHRCQAIVVDSAAGVKAAAAVSDITGKDAVLLVQASGFDRCESSTIQLVEADGRFAFDISQKRARQAGLLVSSRLLRLARKVTE